MVDIYNAAPWDRVVKLIRHIRSGAALGDPQTAPAWAAPAVDRSQRGLRAFKTEKNEEDHGRIKRRRGVSEQD